MMVRAYVSVKAHLIAEALDSPGQAAATEDFEVPVDGAEADAWHDRTDEIVELVRSRMRFEAFENVEDDTPLLSDPSIRSEFRFHNGLRTILD